MIVDNEEKLAAALAFIAENEVLAYDTETTGLNVRRDAVVGFGISNATDGFYFPLYFWNGTTLEPYNSNSAYVVLKALRNKKILCFNASFDLRITKNNLQSDLLQYLYCDVLLLKHTCDEEFPFGLKEIATKLWGHNVKKEKEEMQASIKANGGTTKEYYKASTDTLAKYCIQDCLLTFKIYNHYSRDLKRQGLEDFFYNNEVMPLYKTVTIPMEDSGVRMNVPLMSATLTDITADIEQLEHKVQADIAPFLGIFTEWFLHKDYPMLTYTGKVPLWAKKHKSQAEAWRADNPTGYMFNLHSKPHLKKLFFDSLQLSPLSRTPTGQPQVDEEFLEHIETQCSWVKSLIIYNKLNKIKSTYIERFLDEVEDGVFYPSWMQHRTTSGRYGGDLQQLPRPVEGDDLVAKYTNVIRKFVIAAPGCKLVSADYEQLEPTIFAHTSGDPALQDIFKTGADFYSTVAIRTERLSDVSADKAATNYLGRINKVARQKAKTYALGIAYGMSAYKLKFEIGVDAYVAEDLVRGYFDAFPGLKRWITESHNAAVEHGQVRTASGRVRHLWQAKAIYESYGPDIFDDLRLWKRYNEAPALYAEAKVARKTFKNLINNAVNHQVQGLAASIVNRAAIAIVRRLTELGKKASIIGQIHDELLFEVPEEELDFVCALVQDIMQNIMVLSVPLRTVPQWGNNYSECK